MSSDEIAFSDIETALEYVKSGEKPIVFIVLGTIWSPPCRYTMQCVAECAAMQEYRDNIEFFFVDEESDLEFCFEERIPVGFPVILLFVQQSIVQFLARGQGFDMNRVEQSTRLVRQLNTQQARKIADEALDVLHGRADAISHIDA